MTEILENKDIRVYYFEDGGLRKVGPGSFLHSIKHKHTSIANCKEAIDNLKLSRFVQKDREVQFVIVEYTGILQAKIVEVYNKIYKYDRTTIQTS